VVAFGQQRRCFDSRRWTGSKARAKAEVEFAALTARLKPVPFKTKSKLEFSAVCFDISSREAFSMMENVYDEESRWRMELHPYEGPMMKLRKTGGSKHI
jgi:hypothetical protein